MKEINSPMLTITTIAKLQHSVKSWRNQGLSIAFVPTMGNLHDGHIELVRQAVERADKVVVSIFVNPTQFCVGEDFSSYPRTEQEDAAKLLAAKADLLFLPAVAEMYPQTQTVTVSVPELSAIHCGEFRSGHFDGVATVVTKLFNIVQPDMALFGEKDFQQLAVIKQLVAQLNSPVKIIPVPTIREADGLAMSSRNTYLTAEQRAMAPSLYQSLLAARDAALERTADFQFIQQQQIDFLQQKGFEVDYFSICRAVDLQAPQATDQDLVILAAAKLGKPRLIDNIYFHRNINTEVKQS